MVKKFEARLYMDYDSFCSAKEGVRKTIPAALTLVNNNPTLDDIYTYVTGAKLSGVTTNQPVYKTMPQIILSKNTQGDQIYVIEPPLLYDTNYMKSLWTSGKLAIYDVDKTNFENPKYKDVVEKRKNTEAKKQQYLNKSTLVTNISNNGVVFSKSKLRELLKKDLKDNGSDIDVDKIFYFNIGND